MKSLTHTVTSYVGITTREVIILLSYSLIIGFIFSFTLWGGDSFSYFSGVTNTLLYGGLTFIVLVFILYMQKLAGSFAGTAVESRFSTIGIVLSLVITFVTRGAFIFFIPPGIETKNIKSRQIGRFYVMRTQKDFAMLSIAAVFVLELVAWILLSTSLAETEVFFIIANIIAWVVIYSLIPFDFLLSVLDKNNGVGIGTSILYRSRWVYLFVAAFTISGFIMSTKAGLFTTLIFAFAVACILALWYYMKVEA